MPYGFNDDKSKNDMSALIKVVRVKANTTNVPANSSGVDLEFDVNVPTGYVLVGVVGYQLATYNYGVVNMQKRNETSVRMRVSNRASTAISSGETYVNCLLVREDYF